MSTMTWLERDCWSTAPRSLTPATARFERQGAELVLVVPISANEARNGALVRVPVPGSSVRLRVPGGTTTGHRFQVPRSNAPAPDGFGDLTVVVEVR